MPVDCVKQAAFDLGADLCGIAPAERFDDAPSGFHPRDIYDACTSVIVYAKRLPADILFARSCIPYTHVNALIADEVDRLSLSLSLRLQDMGIANVMVPSDVPYEAWDPARRHGAGILSMRHAGYLAGLGRLGKSTLLINERYGTMIQIGALLAAEELAYDDIASYEACPEQCRLCLDACPRGALDGTAVNQKACRALSGCTNEKGFVLKRCWECRKVCPYATGMHRT